MLQSGKTFFTRVGCMDGRVQHAISDLGKEKFNADYPDTVEEPGLVGILSQEIIDEKFLEEFKFKILNISIDKHNSKGIILFGHEDCAGILANDTQQKQNILKSATIVRSFVPNHFLVIPAFVHKVKDEWIAEELH